MTTLRSCSSLLGLAAVLFLAPAGAQQHPSTPAEIQHQNACVEEERASIERGEGFGMAIAADQAGYPGPRHVLDMAADLRLTAEQRAAIEKIFAGMHERAIARGKEFFEAQARLEQMFREGRPEADLREQSFRLDSIHAELRWIHLSAHLASQKILTPEQIAQYMRLRAM